MLTLISRSKAALQVMLGRQHQPLRAPFTAGTFEEQVFETFIRPGDTVFDIGANRGKEAPTPFGSSDVEKPARCVSRLRSKRTGIDA